MLVDLSQVAENGLDLNVESNEMDGIHDLGGKAGFGKVEVEEDEPYFHEPWESRVFSMVINLGDNTDRFRHAVERIDPISYLSDTYYGRWLGGLETKLVEDGFVTQEEIREHMLAKGIADEGRVAARPSKHISKEKKPQNSEQQANASSPASSEPLFQVGQTVRAVPTGSDGHTRLPAYVRAKKGEIVAQHGEWVFPDSHAHWLGEMPQHLYTVAFSGSELWGSHLEEKTEVRIDLFETYLMELQDE